MSSRRPVILMAVLLILVAGYVARPYVPARFFGSAPNRVIVEPPLPGENSISNLVVRQNDAGVWQASFDYYYTGEPSHVSLSVDLGIDRSEFPSGSYWGIASLWSIERGSHSVTTELSHPGSARATRQVVAKMLGPMSTGATQSILASVQVDQLIDWPSWQEMVETQEFAGKSPDENLKRAIKMINSNQSDQLAHAKTILERLVSRDPALVQGYIELARVAMKTNWGPEGLHHAEGLLSSALQIKPDDANARILMGYVYAHQKRHKAAESLFADAAASNPPNVWLWANWGEVLAMQGKFDQAAAKYREAIDRPMADDAYDQARADAYRKLIALLERKKDLNGMDALYQKSVAEFGDSGCWGISYAKFLLEKRGDSERSIELARKALKVRCSNGDARQILGLANYVVWSKSEGAARTEALNQARIYLPPGSMSMYLLARNESTSAVAAQLVAAGEKIDQKDNEHMNALAYAVQDDDLPATRRLLRLGARPDVEVGYGDVPVALMPVMSGNLEMVKLMQQFGADYARISHQGATAYDFAKQTGDAALSEALSHKPRTL